VPLAREERPLGVLAIDSQAGPAFTEADLEILEALADRHGHLWDSA
jgi:putative methionine-R-sulfoxide reductase with GAF domain